MIIIYLGLGDNDSAFFHMKTVVRERLGGILFVRTHPAFREFRKEPRVKKLLDSVGLDLEKK